MAITFPRPLIDNAHMSEAWIDLVDNVAFSASGNGGFINFSQVNDPLWKGTFVTGILDVPTQAVWSAWRKSLRGGINAFIAYDVRKSAPIAYPNAKVPGDIQLTWDGTADVLALGASGALQIGNLPVTYQFKVGDRIGLEQGGHYGYHEVLEDAAAVEGTVTLNVTPLLFTTLFTTSAVCRVWRPVCQFMIDQSSWVEQGTVENTPVSFNGLQRL